MTCFNQGKVVAEGRLDDDVVLVLEAALTMHHSIVPLADVNMTGLALSLVRGPNIHTETLLNSILESAAVLAAIAVNHVALPCLFIVLPVTRVFTLTIGIDLNSETVSLHLKQGLQLCVHLLNINDQKVPSRSLFETCW